MKKLILLLIIAITITACANRQRAVLKAQTVSDVRNCQKIGVIKFSPTQMAMGALSVVMLDKYAQDNCDAMGGNVIVGYELCYLCKDLDTEYNK